MYAKFFGLRELPFNNTPDPRFFLATPDHEEAVALLTYTVQERKGFVLLTGEVGVGKTLVSRMMLRHFGTRITFANIHHAVQDATDLMESLCTEFELKVEKGASHSQYVHVLHSFLLAQFAKAIPVVLIVDEAQGLPSEAFEQLRMIGNLEADDAKLLQVVILGQPELRHRFASPQLRQLRQRMFRCCHLPALDRTTTEEYIHHRLTLSGAPQLRPFDASALDAIHHHSQGLPRLINTICDNTMLCGYSSDRRRFDREFVETVIAQMTNSEDFELSAATSPEADFQPTAASPQNTPGAIPGSCPVAGMHPYRQRPYASESHEVIEVLARRVAELETRQIGMAASPTPAANGTEPPLPRSSPGYAPPASGSRAGTTEAQEIRTLLGPVIKDARTVLGQIKTGRRAVTHQEARVAGMARKAKAAFSEVRRVYENLKTASARTHQAEQQAQAVCARLLAQTRYSRQLASSLSSAANRSPRDVTESPQTPFSPEGKSTGQPGVGVPAGTGGNGGKPNLPRLLANVGRTTTDVPVITAMENRHRDASPRSTETWNPDPGRTASVAPMSRLTRQVENLLQLVESGCATGPATA